jgi:membrane carboxypeptidase/penicillin-binding protein PbpC
VVGVWAGNNDNRAMRKGGVAMAGPAWNRFIQEALTNLPNESFEEPNLYFDPLIYKPVLRGLWQGNESFVVDRVSGGLATDSTPLETREERVVSNVHTILHWINREDIMGPPPSNPASNPQYTNWEVPIQNWWNNNRGAYPTISALEVPSSPDTAHSPQNKPSVSILEPDDNKSYKKDQTINVRVRSEGTYPLSKIDIFINKAYVGSSKAPVNFSFTPEEVTSVKEDNILTVVFYDTAFNRSEASVRFRVKQ